MLNRYQKLVFLSTALFFVMSCSSTKYTVRETGSQTYHWTASYYGKKFHGRPTASGEIFDMYGRTAAHKTLPFGTRLKVLNTSNNRKVVVTVNDRGPFVQGRQLDLSYGAAVEIGMVRSGIARVKVKILDRDEHYVKRVRFINDRGPFTIQVGSFREKENALRLKRVLSQSYKNIYIDTLRINGAIHYRVCVGKYRSKYSAEKTAEKLAQEGYGVIVITYGKKV